jgi:tetratricopeptide (TPR) repeat protein
MIESRYSMIEIIVLICAFVSLSGCFVTHAVDAKSRQQALELIDRGVVLMRRGDLENAAAAFQVAEELAHLPAALDGLGCIAFLKGENLAAEDFFKRALEIDFSYTEAVGNLALLYEQMGRPQQAEEYFSRAIELSPANYRFRNNYAIFLAQRDSSSKRLAKEQLARALVLVDTPLVEANMLELSKRGE